MDSRGTPANWRPSAISGHLLTTIRQLFPTLVLISGPSLPPQKIQPSTQDRINPWITDKNMASRKFIPYSQPKNIPDSIITSYAQSKSISSSSSYLICPAEKYTQFKFHLIWPAKDHTLFHPICPAEEYNCLFALSRSQHHGSSSLWCRHPSSSPSCPCSQYPAVTSTGCSPCSPPLRVTRLLLPAFRRFARTRDERAKPGPVYPSRTVNIASLNKLVYLTFDTKFQT